MAQDMEIDHHDSRAADDDQIDAPSDSDDDERAVQQTTLSSSEKRKLQNARFNAWASEEKQRQIVNSEKAIKNGTTDQYSIRAIMSQQAETIKHPREYQLELFERAKKQNTIAVLDTGTGKTLIAVLLLRHVIDQELENRLASHPPRIAFFLVNSVTLVFQQAAVLDSNTDHKVGRFCGAMGTELWTKEIWQKHFEEYRIIVCTAEVLHQCLAHGFITMQQINLLIFDEAHHAKLEHPYSKIINGYYNPLKAQARPRIFGMTASPVDAKRDDVEQAAQELEELLHCRIATTKDATLLQKSGHRADEETMYYPPHMVIGHTSFYRSLETQFGQLNILAPMFKRAREIHNHLGAWCADHYWPLALQEKMAPKIEARMGRSLDSMKNGTGLTADVKLFEEALRVVSSFQLTAQIDSPSDVSPKVKHLAEYLKKHMYDFTDSRCIVFVEQRHTARLLSKAFESLGGQEIRPGSLVGSRKGEIGDINVTFREQVTTLSEFRNGDINCLFATSVAEEGLDVPDCNLIVRFDQCKTMIQYIQSRGRARHKKSKFLHMLETGNSEHQTTLHIIREAESDLRRFCRGLPNDRYLGANDAVPLELDRHKTYVVERTQAKITYGNCLQLLAHFVAMLPSDEEEALHPVYTISAVSEKFVCEVILPERSPLPCMTGKTSRRKALAKCSAAFSACVELKRRGLLDDNLLPTYRKQVKVVKVAALALNMREEGDYNMRVKPSIWQVGRGVVPQQLYTMLIDFSDGLDHDHQPLFLITRTPLGAMPTFPIFLNSGKQSNVLTKPAPDAFPVSEDVVAKLTTFTLRMFKDIYNKTYKHDMTKMPYWLAPVRQSCLENLGDPITSIDWSAIDRACQDETYRWSRDMDASFLVNKYIVDPFHGGNRYYSKRIELKYRPTDPVPADVLKFGKAKHTDTILDCSVSLWTKSRAKVTWDLEQPVVEAEKILVRRNMLASPEKTEQEKPTKCYVCPEPLRISSLTPAFVESCMTFPAVIHRIDSYLIGQEIFAGLGLNVDTSLALEAITKDSESAQDEHHNNQQIVFQRGMGNNYERLEFLGDCFLKMTSTIAVFILNPDDSEHEFHVKRMFMICNHNLFNVAQKKGVAKFIRSQAFSRRWYPEGIKLLEGKGANKQTDDQATHHLGDKTVADVCEAIIGAALLTHNKPGNWTAESWTDAIKAVTHMVASPGHEMQQWSDYSSTYEKPKYQVGTPTASQLDLVAKVEKEHGYHFQSPPLLRSVFIHPSQPYLWEKIPSYQRLEFLGDSLIDMACVTHLFYRFPNEDPQWLTEHKMAMVTNKFLGAVCVKLGFHRHLRHNTTSLGRQIRAYTDVYEEIERKRPGAKDNWMLINDPPKCLADILEAYIGAIFLDSDFDYNEVQCFFDVHIAPYFTDMSLYDSFANQHPVTRLFKMLGSTFECREFRLMADEIPSGDGSPKQVIAGLLIHDEVIAKDISKSTRYSYMRAATKALEELREISRSDFQRRFKCDCKWKAYEERANADEDMEMEDREETED